jgi:hypothetical protein
VFACVSLGSSVNEVADYGLDHLDSIPLDAGLFLVTTASKPAVEPTKPLGTPFLNRPLSDNSIQTFIFWECDLTT